MSSYGFPPLGLLGSIAAGRLGAGPAPTPAYLNILQPFIDGTAPPPNGSIQNAATVPQGAAASNPEDPRTVHALASGKVTAVDWQNPSDHNSGMGWRVWVTDDKGGRIGYGHMDSSSTPQLGQVINQGDPLGVYANPTNGHSTAPHVHVQAYDPKGNLVDPGTISPLTRGRIKEGFSAYDTLHPGGHQGIDWVFR